jgi:dGTPase
MQAYGASFDHNLQALRTVEHFEHRYIEFPGLNLTFEVREGIIKHSHDYRAGEIPSLSEYLLDQRPPLEAQLIDLTDEVAYNTADLDDGMEAKILTLQQIRSSLPPFARLYAEIESRYPEAPEKLKFNETLKRLLDRLASDLIVNGRKMIAESGVQSVEDVRRFPRRLLAFSPEIELERRQIKDFLYENLYFSPTLKADKRKGEQIIAETFAFFMTSPKELPSTYQEKTKQEPLHQVVCDYIAGMTDNFIQEQHKRIK